MRAAVVVAASMITAITAHADVMPGVEVGDGKLNGYMAVVLGHMSAETRGDNLGRAPVDYGAWSIGMSMRGEYVDLRTAYGGRFGATLEVDFWLFTPGAIESKGPALGGAGPDQPRLAYVYLGLTPALALGALKTRTVDVALELGAPVNTDFYGVSAGLLLGVKSFRLSYKLRSGVGWHGTQVLDEKIRIGFGGDRSFVGLDITHGYNEDEMSRANLGAILKGGYTMVSLVVSGGTK